MVVSFVQKVHGYSYLYSSILSLAHLFSLMKKQVSVLMTRQMPLLILAANIPYIELKKREN